MLFLLHAMGDSINAGTITTLLQCGKVGVACDAVRRIIEEGPSVWPGFSFQSVFHFAFQRGCFDMLDFLIHAAVPGDVPLTLDASVLVRTMPNFKHRRGSAQQTARTAAMCAGQLAFVAQHCRDVLSHPAVVAAAPTWLTKAATSGHLQVVKRLLEPEWNTVACRVATEAKTVNQAAFTSAMHCACHTGDGEMVQYLLRRMTGCPAFDTVPFTGCTCRKYSTGAYPKEGAVRVGWWIAQFIMLHASLRRVVCVTCDVSHVT